VQADGKIIDTGANWGHSGPAIADIDRDGTRDLIVGDFSGLFHFFRNVGSNSAPKYQAAGDIQAGGEPAKVPIYCCIGSSPHFVDYDGDGNVDLLSGSYDPGQCYLFRGTAPGDFAARETVVDAAGQPVLRVPDQRDKVQSFGSWPATIDWDNDGDLDLVVGGFDGTIFVRLNEGTRTAPKLRGENLAVTINGEPLKVSGNHAAIAIADWDDDGLWDIVSGSDDGGVYWYQNTGKLGDPAFTSEVALLPKHDGIGYNELLQDIAAPRPGIRTQVAVVDYNNDGKQDLLVGDFCTTISPRSELSPEDRAKMAALYKQSNETLIALRAGLDQLRDEFRAKYPGKEIGSDAANAEWDARYKAMQESASYKQLGSRLKQINDELKPYIAPPDKSLIPDDIASSHGYVWLYLRK
jgi:hypothetical protein